VCHLYWCFMDGHLLGNIPMPTCKCRHRDVQTDHGGCKTYKPYIYRRTPRCANADASSALDGEPPSAATRQLALVAFSATAQHFAAAAPQAVLAAVPAIVAAMRDPKRAVRGSALAAAAAAVATLGPRAVPVLPRLAPAVLAAAAAALDGLPAARQVRHMLTFCYCGGAHCHTCRSRTRMSR